MKQLNFFAAALLGIGLLALPAAASAQVVPITSDLRLWLRADVDVYEDIDGLDAAEDGDGVAHWDDQLVAGENTTNNFAKAASTSRQPVFLTNVLNGLPVVQFTNDATDTQDDFMNGDGGALLSQGTAARTVFVVARQNSGSEGSPALIELNAQASSTYDGSQYRVTAETGVRVSNGYRIFDKAISKSQFQLLTVQTPAPAANTTANTLAWLDGVSLGQQSLSDQIVNTGTAGYRLAGGTGGNAGGSLSGELAEVLVYESALNDTDRAAVEEYLTSKYRLRTQAIADASKPIKVFLLGGQSNMAGQGDVADLATLRPALDGPQTDVAIWQNLNNASNTNTGWEVLAPGQGASTSLIGPELSLGRALADAFPDYQVALVKFAEGGTNLDVEWDPKDSGSGAYMYDGFVESLANALGALDADGLTYEIDGMFWMQGERDARFADMASRYEGNLTDLIDAVRDLTGETELPFILGRVADDLAPSTYTELDVVRGAQGAVAAADPYVAMVDTDPFGMNSDNLHFSASGQLDLGDAFAATFLAVPEPSTLAMLAAGLLAGAVLIVRRRK